MDSLIGELLQALKDGGAEQHTAVVFTGKRDGLSPSRCVCVCVCVLTLGTAATAHVSHFHVLLN
eukprot:COSAG03_NODE_1698_length_3631_cov_8.163080_3_plen_64_part_00